MDAVEAVEARVASMPWTMRHPHGSNSGYEHASVV